MNIDLFRGLPSWRYYIYASLVVLMTVIFGYALLRTKRRIGRIAKLMAVLSFYPLLKLAGALVAKRKDKVKESGIEAQPFESAYELATVLKWAASSGRTELIRKVLQGASSPGQKPLKSSGPAIMVAIRNGHQEAAAILIDTGEGLDYLDENKGTLLHCAARNGEADLVKKLLDRGMSLTEKDQDGQTALDYAMMGNDESTINLLLHGGQKATRQETANIQSLHFSARTGDLAAIKELYNKGSSLEARDGKGQTVLFHAVKGRQYGTLKWLLKQGVNVQSIDKEGLTALHVAAQVCDVQAAQTLIDHGADANALSVNNLTPLLCLSSSAGVPILLLLQQKGADLHAVDKEGNTIAHKLAKRGDVAAELFKVVRDLGGDMHASGSQGNTPAHFAAQSGSISILEVLSSGDDGIYESRDIAGYTPLMTAAHAAKTDVMRFMLKRKVSYEVSDVTGKTLVHLTIEWGNPTVMQVLQDFGADYNNFTTTTDVAHPIWKAIQEGQLASIQRLLDSGLSINYQYGGVSLLQLAAEVNNAEAVRLLLRRDASVDKADSHGWTALHSAAFSGNTEYVSSILQRNADKNVRDEYGWTPLDLAAFYRHEDVVKLLDPESETKYFAWMRAIQKVILMGGGYQSPALAESVISGVVEAPSAIG